MLYEKILFSSILGNTKKTVVLLNHVDFAVTTSKQKVIEREYNAMLSISETKYLKFIHSPPRSSFKKLFIGNNLGEALQKGMSDTKALPKGLRDEEVERGKIRRPLIPYIPTEDPIHESTEGKSWSKKFKVTLPDGTIVYHKVYNTGENKSFCYPHEGGLKPHQAEKVLRLL